MAVSRAPAIIAKAMTARSYISISVVCGIVSHETGKSKRSIEARLMAGNILADGATAVG